MGVDHLKTTKNKKGKVIVFAERTKRIMKKRILTGAAVAALGGLALFGLASCGEQGSSVSDGGKVLNIRVWNDAFISRFSDY